MALEISKMTPPLWTPRNKAQDFYNAVPVPTLGTTQLSNFSQSDACKVIVNCFYFYFANIKYETICLL